MKTTWTEQTRLISNALRRASLSSGSTGQCRLNYTKHNRCRAGCLNETDIATNLLGRNFHITSQIPISELNAIFRGWRRYIENAEKAKYCIRGNLCSQTYTSGECGAISGFDCQYKPASQKWSATSKVFDCKFVRNSHLSHAWLTVCVCVRAC